MRAIIQLIMIIWIFTMTVALADKLNDVTKQLKQCQSANVILQAFMDGEFDDALPTQEEIDSWKHSE